MALMKATLFDRDDVNALEILDVAVDTADADRDEVH